MWFCYLLWCRIVVDAESTWPLLGVNIVLIVKGLTLTEAEGHQQYYGSIHHWALWNGKELVATLCTCPISVPCRSLCRFATKARNKTSKCSSFISYSIPLKKFDAALPNTSGWSSSCPTEGGVDELMVSQIFVVVLFWYDFIIQHTVRCKKYVHVYM